MLAGLAAGNVTPAEANDWATPFVVDESTHPDEMDAAVWGVLTLICGADVQSSPGRLLHGPEDFQVWLDEFRSRC